MEREGGKMILEVAILNVKPGQEREFEAAFGRAQLIICEMQGYVSHQLQQCIEEPCRYLLLVNWETMEDHTVGFRQSGQYQQWRQLLHHFYDPIPEVQHYRGVFENSL
ncbi:MAG: antibiotic biosynthesis monooxygenase [Halioglobus sp.]